MSHPTARPHNESGYSLLELVIVIGIIVLLIAILIPVVGRVREASRSTKCLANLQQLGYAYQMYLGSGHVSSIGIMPGDSNGVRWWEFLMPYIRNSREALLCSDAREPVPGVAPPKQQGTVQSGAALYAWQGVSFTGPTQQSVRNDYLGSYGFNSWLHGHPPLDPKKYPPGSYPVAKGPIHYPVKNAAIIPLLGDNRMAWSVASTADPVPNDLYGTLREVGLGMGGYCIDRHRMAINIVFLDGHGEHVPLAGLWQLKWSENSIPRNVVVPAP